MSLLKSKHKVFCRDIHNFLQAKNKTEIYNVETFNTAFNTEACRLIKSIEQSARYTVSSNKLSANPYKTQKFSSDKLSANPYKTQKGEDTDVPATDHRVHCNGCEQQHKPPCRYRYEYKAEYNNNKNTPYASSNACRQATARRQLMGQEPSQILDMLYKSPNEVEPADNPFKSYGQTTSSYDRGRGRGFHSSGEGCIHCSTLPNYSTSITNDGESHLIPLSTKTWKIKLNTQLQISYQPLTQT